MVDTRYCPCGSEQHYNQCCKPFHDGTELPQSAVVLMRSRYSAYVKNLIQYLLDTWHPTTRPPHLDTTEPGFRWLTLKVTGSEQGQEGDSDGIVEFEASFKYGNQRGEVKEKSKFLKENGRWFYLDALQ